MTSAPPAPALRAWVREALAGLEVRRRDVSFLLGTDELIPRERRVALIPRHVGALRRDLGSLGLEPRIFVVRGAGERAEDDAGRAFADDEYAAAGAELVARGEVASLGSLDVVHALKEPTDYESELRGPLIRIGALHLASRPCGLKRMLARRNFAAILDGGTVGNCSYLEHGGDPTPIVASMSRFAGAVSGRKVVEALERRGIGPGTVIVVGGGIAGRSAIGTLAPKVTRLIVVEPFKATQDRLRRELPARGFADFAVVTKLDDRAFEGAVGIVFAHRSGAKAAEKICDEAQIRRMRKGAAIADIAIDQGGSIRHDDYRADDDVTTSRDKTRARLEPDYFYFAESNMPRAEPHEASETHGDCSLPYVTALVALVASHGDPRAAVNRLLERERRVYDDAGELPSGGALELLLQDLRNGVQLVTSGRGVAITDPDIERDVGLTRWIHDCAAS